MRFVVYHLNRLNIIQLYMLKMKKKKTINNSLRIENNVYYLKQLHLNYKALRPFIHKLKGSQHFEKRPFFLVQVLLLYHSFLGQRKSILVLNFFISQVHLKFRRATFLIWNLIQYLNHATIWNHLNFLFQIWIKKQFCCYDYFGEFWDFQKNTSYVARNITC